MKEIGHCHLKKTALTTNLCMEVGFGHSCWTAPIPINESGKLSARGRILLSPLSGLLVGCPFLVSLCRERQRNDPPPHPVHLPSFSGFSEDKGNPLLSLPSRFWLTVGHVRQIDPILGLKSDSGANSVAL